ncbi:MAG: phage holin family protein [Caldilineales bacterium]|nr:phage holin family protein [Caldilineales bacterium]
MARILLRIFINALALIAAAYFVDGVGCSELNGSACIQRLGAIDLLLVATIFGAVNALLKPILKILTCPLQVLTLGLFTFVLNALLLWLTGAIGDAFNIGFVVAGFWPAFWGALIVSIASVIAGIFLPD